MGTPSLDPRQSFARVVSRPPSNINLVLAALYVAAEDTPSLDVVAYMGRLSDISKNLRPRISNRHSLYDTIYAINDLLFKEIGFSGNSGNYYDIRNSHLNQVLDRKLGIPITLSIIYMEVARRVGVEFEGVNVAGHFMVATGRGPSLIFVDPFSRGRLYTRWECLRLQRRDGGTLSHDPITLERLERTYLPRADNRLILARLLNNMKIIHTKTGHLGKAIASAERIQILMPRNWRNIGDIAQLQGKSGRARDAYDTLSQMVQLMPPDIDPSLQLDALELLKPLAESNEEVDPEQIHEIPFFRI